MSINWRFIVRTALWPWFDNFCISLVGLSNLNFMPFIQSSPVAGLICFPLWQSATSSRSRQFPRLFDKKVIRLPFTSQKLWRSFLIVSVSKLIDLTTRRIKLLFRNLNLQQNRSKSCPRANLICKNHLSIVFNEQQEKYWMLDVRNFWSVQCRRIDRNWDASLLVATWSLNYNFERP